MAEARRPAVDPKLDKLLKLWGIAYAERRHFEEYRRRATHPIATSMQFGTRSKRRRKDDSHTPVGRSGVSRRRIMARAVGIKGLNIIPADYVDPVPCKEGGRGGGIYSRPVHPELVRVETAVKELEELRPLRGLCVRMNFCTEGTHQEKAEAVTERMRKVSKDFRGISVDQFRDEVLFGRVWLEGRLFAPPQAA